MRRIRLWKYFLGNICLMVFYGGLVYAAQGGSKEVSAANAINNDKIKPGSKLTANDGSISAHGQRSINLGREIFRFDTFGDEDFWGGQLKLHQAIAGEENGGVGSGLSPAQALALGLKVDRNALPSSIIRRIRRGTLDENDPKNTLLLLRRNAIVGVKGFFDDSGTLESVGIQCAFCHSTVDDSITSGVGKRLDGWANRDLDVGKIISLAPDLSPLTSILAIEETTLKTVLNSWGPGKFDAELLLDGIGSRPGGGPAATLIPPVFGLAGVNLHTWTGWGSVPYWNAFVANIPMMGKGTFFDPRLNDAEKFPVAARVGFGNIRNEDDRITSKLAPLHLYQLAIPAPKPPSGSFDEVAAERGGALFQGKANCNRCHVEPLYTEPGWNMHTPEEVGVDDFQASRSPDERYRTSPLKGIWTHQKGGFYHDGRFSSLREVVDHYDTLFGLGLTDAEKDDLVEYLKSL